MILFEKFLKLIGLNLDSLLGCSTLGMRTRKECVMYLSILCPQKKATTTLNRPFFVISQHMWKNFPLIPIGPTAEFGFMENTTCFTSSLLGSDFMIWFCSWMTNLGMHYLYWCYRDGPWKCSHTALATSVFP